MKYLWAIIGGMLVGMGLSGWVSLAAQAVVPGPVTKGVTVEMARSVAFGLKANGHVAPITLDDAGRVLCTTGPVK